VVAHLALAFDSKARLALPQGDAPAVDVQPFSNMLWAFLGCWLSCAVFGIADAHLFQPMGVPFMMGRCAARMRCALAPASVTTLVHTASTDALCFGSFGTISVLYFGAGLRAPVLRLWNVVVGHLAAASFAALALAFIQPLWLARATALAATVSFMLWTGAVHPPGGALVIILADSAKFQALGGYYLLWPGLAGALALYACAAATDELKRRFVFELSDVAAALRLRPAAPRPTVATA
jgi:CBS-domain-containing membrane protein